MPSSAGKEKVWPCGSARPNASNLNLVAAQTIPNTVIAKVGDGGKVCLFTQSGAHLLSDVPAYSAVYTLSLHDALPILLETRPDYGQVGYSGGQPAAGDTIELQVAGSG